VVDGKAQGKDGSAENNPVIGEIYLPDHDTAQTNAELIVKTVNNHSELVNICQDMLKFLDTLQASYLQSEIENKQAMRTLIKQALAAVKS